jgi:alkanesulfonate monooxygenase SsuD/methylene tetrahydromethanopterin reductase-like flavin-dependent oxidoreductase (luciferase family)
MTVSYADIIPMTACVLGHILEAKAQAAPHHPFLVWHGQNYSYGELNGRANQLARQLCSSGVTRGDRVAVLMDSSPSYIDLWFALAKLGAALDVVCGGRFVFGVGVGGEIAKEFEACGVPLTERGARTDEALALIKRLWTERGVSFAGRFNTLNDISIDPPPLRKPHPPIWVAGRKDSAARRAGRYADGWLPYMYTPEQLHESIAKVRAFAEQAGRDPESVRAGIFIWSAVHEDAALAKRAASEYLSANYAQDFSKLAPRYALAGDPAQCVARLAEDIDAGAERVVLAPAWSASADTDRSVELMATSVMPAFR